MLSFIGSLCSDYHDECDDDDSDDTDSKAKPGNHMSYGDTCKLCEHYELTKRTQIDVFQGELTLRLMFCSDYCTH